MQTQTTTQPPTFQLAPPEVLQPVAEQQARTAVPLPP